LELIVSAIIYLTSFRVKVATDTETNKTYAMKLMYVEDAEDQEDFDLSLFLTLMNNEVERLEKLPAHENIISLVEYNWKGILKTSKGAEKEVLYCVLDLATGGDLFDYIFTVGRGLPENIARFYFHKLIDSIQFLHENNVVHRDLKLENLLLDSDFILKIADFGLSTTVESEYGGGVMHTRVGTERYMPPEMLEKNAYVGICSDLFACGIILFVLVIGIMPTHKTAESNDYLYKYVRKKEYEKYWTVISKLLNLDLSEISEDFFHLVTTMIKYDYKKRFTIDEIKNHAWMKGEIATEDEVRKELAARKKEIKRKLGEEEFDTDCEDVANRHSEEFETIERGDEDEWNEDEQARQIKVYNPEFPAMTEFFSTFGPNVLLGAVHNFCKDKKLEFKLGKEDYSASVQMPSEDDNIVDFVVEVLQSRPDDEVGEEDEDKFADVEEDEDTKFCVVFRKKRGPKQDFIKIFKGFRYFCKRLNNTDMLN
jgi:serine/threonine protein kinase